MIVDNYVPVILEFEVSIFIGSLSKFQTCISSPVLHGLPCEVSSCAICMYMDRNKRIYYIIKKARIFESEIFFFDIHFARSGLLLVKISRCRAKLKIRTLKFSCAKRHTTNQITWYILAKMTNQIEGHILANSVRKCFLTYQDLGRKCR